MIEEHANYIDGAWRPALAEHVFEISAAGDRGRPLARFPRSSARDVEAAITACAAAESAWQRRPRDGRRAFVARALDILARDRSALGTWAESLGLREDEVDRQGADPTADSWLERDVALSGPGGVHAVQCHWSEASSDSLREVFARILAGQAVVLLSDPHVPFVAESLARAADAAGWPSGVLALVHDDRDTCLDALLGDARVESLRAAGPRARVREIERRAQRHRHLEEQRREHRGENRVERREVSAASSRARARFGAGLDVRRGPELDLTPLRNASYVVTIDADPAAAAREVVERAFGRAQSFSGQRPGSIGRVACHQRQFSRFTAELLAELERHPDVALPLAAREPATLDHLRRASALGLDEGATLVFSPAENAVRNRDRNGSDEPESAPAPSRDRRADGILWPAVFTNVEEHMRIAWLGRPAPVLCLMRVASDASGAALAQSIDRDPLAEDLSARAEEEPGARS